MKKTCRVVYFVATVVASWACLGADEYPAVDPHPISDNFKREVLDPMQLKGMNAREALSRMVNIGLRCTVSSPLHKSELSATMPRVMLACERKLSEVLDGYPLQTVTFRTAQLEDYQSRSKLFENLDLITVTSFSASPLVVWNSSVREDRSTSQLSALKKKYGADVTSGSTIAETVGRLIDKNFYCGLDTSSEARNEHAPAVPSVACSLPGALTSCRYAMVRMTAEGPMPPAEARSKILWSREHHVGTADWSCLVPSKT